MAEEFLPRRRLAQGDVMTVYAWARARRFPALPEPEARLFRVAPEAQVLAHCHWRTDRTAAPTLLILHGLEGSSDAHYVAGMADKAWSRGFNVVRLNQRNCGGTEHLSATLYHSGLTADVARVIDELTAVDGLPSIVVAGYSLGGNLAVKLAGEAGEAPPPALRGVIAVSPTIDLPRCITALERPRNYAYQWNFVRNLRARMRRKAALFPDRFSVEGLAAVRTVRQFDERYTAPHFGFQGAADYYHRASALRVVDRIRIAAAIVTAEDDPFVPPESFRDPAVTANPRIHVTVTRAGGHCAFVGEPNGYDGYWAERAVVDFAARVTA